METQIQIKINEAEKEIIRVAALRVGLGISPFVRSVVLGHINSEVSK